ncbi:MAG TPA: alpha/beta hydrolase [Patescibacteria group bacterium]|nr:alpha/beta hydrolase [Patescibacteria group bacterium]
MIPVQVFGKKARGRTPILLLHGWNGEWRSWYPVIEHLKPSEYLIVPTLPGFAGMTLIEPYTLEKYVRDVIAMLAELGVKKVMVIGHSLGGAIGAVLASQYPETVKKLVLVDASGIRPELSAARKIWTVAVKGVNAVLGLPGLLTIQPMLRKTLYSFGPFKHSDYADISNDMLRETYLNIIHDDISDRLVTVACPTLLVWGENDTETPLWQGKMMSALVPQSRLVTIPGVSHFSYLEKPETFYTALKEFLA